MRAPRRIHQNMQTAEPLAAFDDKALAIGNPVDVGGDADSASVRDLRRRFFRRLAVDVSERDAGAGLRQCRGHFLAEPLRGSGHDRNFALEPDHAFRPIWCSGLFYAGFGFGFASAVVSPLSSAWMR